MRFKLTEKGFTLVEMAMVLVLVGILVSLGMGLMGPLMKAAKYTETKETVSAALTSAIGYATTNNRLPTTAEFPTVVRNPRDAWTTALYYIPDGNLTTSANGGICGRKSTGMTVLKCPDAVCAAPTSTITDVALLVVAAAENRNIQTAIAAGTAKVYITDLAAIDDYATDLIRPEPYDDVAGWLTLNELRIRAGCVGTQLRLVNNDLPSGVAASAYAATVYPDAGVPFTAGGKYRWCVQGAVPAGLAIAPATTSVNCLTLAEASWGQADTLAFSGTPTAPGSYNLIIFARDNNDSAGANDNVAQRSFVITVSP
jgi:prepilin-type N-terminal cleavage/methylation domain-containing protein